MALEHQSNGQIISQHENPDESRMQKRVKSGREINQRNIERDNMFNSSSLKSQKAPKGYLSVISRDENTEFNHFNSQKPDYHSNNRLFSKNKNTFCIATDKTS